MEKLDPQNLNDEQKLGLDDFLYRVLDQSFQRTHYDYSRFKLNCALHQKTIRQGVVDGDHGRFGVSKDYIKESDGVTIDPANKPDEFSSLFSPILLESFRRVKTNVGNIVFPLDGNQATINRTYAEFFDDNNINEFLPEADDCWKQILETENRNNQSKAVYESVLAEGLAHAVWALDHEYDDQSEVVEPLAPGVDNVGLYPLRSDWRKSNRCFYVDINYNQLLEREDLDQTIIAQLQAEVQHRHDEQSSSSNAHHNPGSVPFGQVRLVKFYCPSVYIDYNNKVYHAEGLYVVAIVNPNFKPDSKQVANTINKLHILKAQVDVPMDRHGLLLGCPVTNMPKEFFNEGIFYPWLDHQITANEFYSNATRVASYLSKGPFNSEQSGFGSVQTEDEDFTKGFHPFQILKGKKFTPVFSAEHIQFIKVAYETINQIKRDIENGIGAGSKIQTAVNNGGNLKDEVLKATEAEFLQVLDYAVRFNEQIYIPSLFTRAKSEQDILKAQVDAKLNEIKELYGFEEDEMQEFVPPDEMIIEQILETNKLFKRLVNNSGIKPRYREFYKKRQKKILENQSIMFELGMMEQEIMQKVAYSQSPIVDEAMPPFPLQRTIDPETQKEIMVEMTAAEKQQFRNEWRDSEKQERFQAGNEANAKLLEVQKKQLSLSPVEEIPPLSNMLLFNILVAPIEESNIKIGGVLSALLKSLTSDEVKEIVRLVSVMPESESKKVDFGDLFMLATKGKAITKDLIMKSEEEITRQEEAEEKQAEFDRQVSIEMAKNPGAQPPQVGAGNKSG